MFRLLRFTSHDKLLLNPWHQQINKYSIRSSDFFICLPPDYPTASPDLMRAGTCQHCHEYINHRQSTINQATEQIISDQMQPSSPSTQPDRPSARPHFFDAVTRRDETQHQCPGRLFDSTSRKRSQPPFLSG
jgi:hypothetical protein